MKALVPAIAAALMLVGTACDRGEPRSGQAAPVRIDVLADTGRSQTLHVRKPPPEAKVWLAQVSPSRAPSIEPPLPVPSPDLIQVPDEPPRLEIDPSLKPPILRRPGLLRVPAGRRGAVELDVRVSEDGEVSDALWAGGTEDSVLIAAAVSCALEMRFYPAIQAGRPVAVWCRQRFDFAGH